MRKVLRLRGLEGESWAGDAFNPCQEIDLRRGWQHWHCGGGNCRAVEDSLSQSVSQQPHARSYVCTPVCLSVYLDAGEGNLSQYQANRRDKGNVAACDTHFLLQYPTIVRHWIPNLRLQRAWRAGWFCCSSSHGIVGLDQCGWCCGVECSK